jgi:hypothetical protein
MLLIEMMTALRITWNPYILCGQNEELYIVEVDGTYNHDCNLNPLNPNGNYMSHLF